MERAASPHADDRPSGTDMAMLLATWATGLGVITFALFPFLIPGLALVLVPLVLFVPLLVLVPVIALPLWLVRAVRRRRRRRTRSRVVAPAAHGNR